MKIKKIHDKLDMIAELSELLAMQMGPRNNDKMQEHIRDIKELLKPKKK